MQRSDFEGKIRRGRYIGAGTHVPQGDSLIPASYNTAGVVTYLPTDIYNGLIVRNPNGGARSDVLPSAAALVAATPGVQVGDIIFRLPPRFHMPAWSAVLAVVLLISASALVLNRCVRGAEVVA